MQSQAKNMNLKNGKLEYADKEQRYFIATPNGRTANPNMLLMPLHPIDAAASDNHVRRLAEEVVARGAAIVFFEGAWQDLTKLAEAVKQGHDAFEEIIERINSAIFERREHNFQKGGKTILIGASKFGYASLYAMSCNPHIDAVVAVLSVTYWPALHEFEGMECDVLVRRYDLAARTQEFDGREILFEKNQEDYRVRDDLTLALARSIKAAYSAKGRADNLTISRAKSKGHATSQENEDNILNWLVSKNYL